jgi:hypothetical protein
MSSRPKTHWSDEVAEVLARKFGWTAPGLEGSLSAALAAVHRCDIHRRRENVRRSR